MYSCVKNSSVECSGCGRCIGENATVCECCGEEIVEDDVYFDEEYDILCYDCLLEGHRKEEDEGFRRAR